ncbi:MAG: lycopene cyclase domain-containing protein [Bacteroidales bacterium]
MSLYLTLLVASVSMPLLLSFDRKVGFYKHWRYIFPSILITAVFFILVDIYFTRWGVWGFNPRYHSGIILYGMPLEEWLFFVIIPYASLFIHYVFVSYFPHLKLNGKLLKIFSGLIALFLLLLILLNSSKIYTLVYFSVVIILLLVSLLTKPDLLARYFITFLIILVPFFVVNAILTGTFIDEEVVWYNSDHILGRRILTVPVEDIGYTFSLMLMNLMLISGFERIFRKKKV